MPFHQYNESRCLWAMAFQHLVPFEALYFFPCRVYLSIHLKDELKFWDELFRPQDKFSGQIFALRTKYFGLEWHFVL